MAVVVKEGNVFDSDADIICHQVNCQGVMGSGVAKEVRERFPNVYEQYHELCELHKNYSAGLLGTAQIVLYMVAATSFVSLIALAKINTVTTGHSTLQLAL